MIKPQQVSIRNVCVQRRNSLFSVVNNGKDVGSGLKWRLINFFSLSGSVWLLINVRARKRWVKRYKNVITLIYCLSSLRTNYWGSSGVIISY